MDYQYQLTQIYNKLSAIDSSLAKLALLSYVNTVQSDLTSRINAVAGDLNTVIADVQSLKLTVSDLLTRLRSA